MSFFGHLLLLCSQKYINIFWFKGKLLSFYWSEFVTALYTSIGFTFTGYSYPNRTHQSQITGGIHTSGLDKKYQPDNSTERLSYLAGETLRWMVLYSSNLLNTILSTTSNAMVAATEENPFYLDTTQKAGQLFEEDILYCDRIPGTVDLKTGSVHMDFKSVQKQFQSFLDQTFLNNDIAFIAHSHASALCDSMLLDQILTSLTIENTVIAFESTKYHGSSPNVLHLDTDSNGKISAPLLIGGLIQENIKLQSIYHKKDLPEVMKQLSRHLLNLIDHLSEKKIKKLKSPSLKEPYTILKRIMKNQNLLGDNDFLNTIQTNQMSQLIDQLLTITLRNFKNDIPKKYHTYINKIRKQINQANFDLFKTYFMVEFRNTLWMEKIKENLTDKNTKILLVYGDAHIEDFKGKVRLLDRNKDEL